MDYEKKYEAEALGHAIGKAVGEEIKKAYKSRTSRDYAKEYREKNEYVYKSLLYFINISIVISYTAGALAIQLPFIDKFGIMPYDIKMYLLVGVIIFVIIQVAVFASSVYEQIAAAISESIANSIMDRLRKYELEGLQPFVRIIIFIPTAWGLLSYVGKWLNNSVDEKYWGMLFATLLFIKIYVVLSLIFQDKRYGSIMNITNFALILIALTVSLYAGKTTFEEYLLTDAKLIHGQGERSIELLINDHGTIYFKENNECKCEILKDDTIIEFQKD